MNGVVYHGNNESRRLIEEHEFYYTAGGGEDDSDDGQDSADPGGRWVAERPRSGMRNRKDLICGIGMH